jgi:sensor histidine kinase YesM
MQYFAENASAKQTVPQQNASTMYTWPLWRMMQWLMVGGFAVFLHAQRRETRAMTERLRAAELNRLAKSRATAEARLMAMQARIEPQFLFDTLAQVRELYRREVVLASVVRASKMLDELIAYLRAAMPHVRDPSSIVAREVALTRAYLDIMRLRIGDGLHVEIACTEAVERARLPPMVLLPLVQRALARCNERDRAGIHIAIRGDGSQLRVTMACVGAAAALRHDAEALGGLRERLDSLYGATATLAFVETGTETSEARLAVPLHFPVQA